MFFISHMLQSNTKPITQWSMPLGVSDNHSVLKGKQNLLFTGCNFRITM